MFKSGVGPGNIHKVVEGEEAVGSRSHLVVEVVVRNFEVCGIVSIVFYRMESLESYGE